MKVFLTQLYRWLALFGFDPVKLLQALSQLPRFVRDYRTFKNQAVHAGNVFSFGQLYPCLHDRLANAGSVTGHYFQQDLFVAQRIFVNAPTRHVDVGSRIDGFVTHVASFRPIEVLDIRPLPYSIPNVSYRHFDILAPIATSFHFYCDSLSCLHALEHFGLGRYGDSLSFDGHLRALDNLHRLLAPGGRLYLSVPIGPQRIEFNAHRVFAMSYLLQAIETMFCVDQLSFIDDENKLHVNVSYTDADIANSFGCAFGCGIFELVKK